MRTCRIKPLRTPEVLLQTEARKLSKGGRVVETDDYIVRTICDVLKKQTFLFFTFAEVFECLQRGLQQTWTCVHATVLVFTIQKWWSWRKTQLKSIDETLDSCYKTAVQGKGSNWDLFSNQYLFPKSLLSLTLENHKHPIDSHCKYFNSLIPSCHTWNISKKCPSQISLLVDQLDMLQNVTDFLGINTDLRINPNSIPYPVYDMKIYYIMPSCFVCEMLFHIGFRL